MNQEETKYFLDDETPIFIISEWSKDLEDFEVIDVIDENGASIPESIVTEKQARRIVKDYGSEPIEQDYSIVKMFISNSIYVCVAEKFLPNGYKAEKLNQK